MLDLTDRSGADRFGADRLPGRRMTADHRFRKACLERLAELTRRRQQREAIEVQRIAAADRKTRQAIGPMPDEVLLCFVRLVIQRRAGKNVPEGWTAAAPAQVRDSPRLSVLRRAVANLLEERTAAFGK